MALHKETILRKERILHEEMMIRRHQKMKKEALIMGSPHHLRGEVYEGKEKGRVMTMLAKDLVNLEEVAIRREVIRMRLGLCGAVLGRVGAGMRK